jgi:hypothetical protein
VVVVAGRACFVVEMAFLEVVLLDQPQSLE